MKKTKEQILDQMDRAQNELCSIKKRVNDHLKTLPKHDYELAYIADSIHYVYQMLFATEVDIHKSLTEDKY